MKKILILLIAICCCGCSSVETPQKTVVKGNRYELSAGTSIRYIEFDGHQFIEYKCGGVHGGGSLCHSPKCPCKTK